MKLIRKSMLVTSLVVVGFQLCQAQVPADSKPAASNIRGAQYPRILADNRVIFQIKAPAAQKIQIQLDKRYDMQRDSLGVWTVTTGVQSPGFHYYSLLIDGIAVADPASESFYGMGRMASGLEVPDKDGDYYTLKNVPHGDVRSKNYFSQVTQSWRRMYIYTPPGYDVNAKEKYPVLYIQHGGGEDERGWVTQGKADIILDNLIAQGKARPMLIVMADGNLGGGMGDDAREKFKDEMLKSVIPFVESNFRVLANAKNRALSGLSMGGLETLYTGIPNTNVFGYLGVLSSGWLPNQKAIIEKYNAYVEKNSALLNKNLGLLFIAMGGKEDIAYQNCQLMLKSFDTYGLKYTYHEIPGGHTWPVWRENLYTMAPLLFK